jgi:3-oxoacyl-[acyl-carrier protein] reductase
VAGFINLIKKKIIITGTSSGLGLELAKKFLSDGNYVWGCSRSKSSILHKNYSHSIIDIEKVKQINKWVNKIKNETTNNVDLLILNAAYYKRNLNFFESDKDIVKTISINLISSILIIKKITELMLKKNKGMIVFFSSSAVVVKDVGTSSYSSSKAGLEMFAKILDKEIKKFKIKTFIFRINYIKTKLSKSLTRNRVKKLKKKFSTNKFKNVNQVYLKILELLKKKTNTKNILISDKLR